MEILNQFGINPLLLAAQAVNFVVLLLILKKLLYKPLLKVLEERRTKIAESLKNAEEIEKRLNETTEREAEVLLKAAKEGEKMIKSAGEQAAQIIEQGTKEYERLVNKGVEDAKNLVQIEKEVMMRQVKEGIADLVALAFKKVTGKTLTEKDKKTILEKEIRNIS